MEQKTKSDELVICVVNAHVILKDRLRCSVSKFIFLQKISVISMVLQARYSVVTFFPVCFLLVVGADIYVVVW